jgi:anti-sigma B factor antagonist
MKITDEEKNGAAVIHLGGKIMGGPDATMFHGKLHEYLDAGQKKVVIDLTKVEWMNSTGLGMLTAALTTVKRAKGELVIAGVADSVLNLLNITQLVRVFRVVDTVDEALR